MNQYTSQNVVFGKAFANIVLAALKTVPGGALLATGKLRLSKASPFNPTSGMSLADLEADEADFSGYPAGGVAVSLTTGVNVTPQIQGAVTRGIFEAATATPFVGNSVTGYWVDDGTEMAIGEAFTDDQVAAFNAVGDFLILNALIPLNLLQGLS